MGEGGKTAILQLSRLKFVPLLQLLHCIPSVGDYIWEAQVTKYHWSFPVVPDKHWDLERGSLLLPITPMEATKVSQATGVSGVTPSAFLGLGNLQGYIYGNLHH